MQPESPPFSWLKQSHRTLAEQIVGLFLYLSVSFSFAIYNYWISARKEPLLLLSFSTAFWLEGLLALSIGSSIWVLWRKVSLTTLGWELSLFFGQLLLLSIWHLTIFVFLEPFLSLIFLLFLFFILLITIFLFWKKEKWGGIILFFPLLWIFYTMGINMMICIQH